jgi:hypothetical protein
MIRAHLASCKPVIACLAGLAFLIAAGSAARAQAGSDSIHGVTREDGDGIRFSVQKCDNAKMLERFLSLSNVKPL